MAEPTLLITQLQVQQCCTRTFSTVMLGEFTSQKLVHTRDSAAGSWGPAEACVVSFLLPGPLGVHYQTFDPRERLLDTMPDSQGLSGQSCLEPGNGASTLRFLICSTHSQRILGMARQTQGSHTAESSRGPGLWCGRKHSKVDSLLGTQWYSPALPGITVAAQDRFHHQPRAGVTAQAPETPCEATDCRAKPGFLAICPPLGVGGSRPGPIIGW